jgi:hypothetical protein
MEMGGRRSALIGIAVFLAVQALGCGGDASSRTGTGSQSAALYPWLKGPSREFLVPGGDNAVPTFGREATRGERAQASRTIRPWMRARAAKAWARDCSYFSRKFSRTITADAHGVSHGKVRTCAQALAFFGSEASGDFVDTLAGSVGSLRVEGGQGYAQYHGNDGHDWVVPMDRESGKWKVAAAAPLEREG